MKKSNARDTAPQPKPAPASVEFDRYRQQARQIFEVIDRVKSLRTRLIAATPPVSDSERASQERATGQAWTRTTKFEARMIDLYAQSTLLAPDQAVGNKSHRNAQLYLEFVALMQMIWHGLKNERR